MGIIGFFDSKIKYMSVWDIGLIKWSVLAFTLMIAKLWAPILSLDWYWYLIAGIVFVIKPTMKLFKN